MSDKIEPALTAEEWTDYFADCKYHNDEGSIDARLEAQMVAMSNNRLPADHPLKLTRQDVLDVQRACDIIEEVDDGHVWRRYCRLRDKLAALLPPEKA